MCFGAMCEIGERPVMWSILIVAAVMAAPAPSCAAPGGQDVIGIPSEFVTRESDTLLDVARAHDLGYVETRAANPGIDPWLPGTGKTLALPTQHVLPDAPRRGIVINLSELRIYYFPPRGGEPRTFPIGIGGEGKETPLGTTKIARKRVHPAWVPTTSEHEEEPELPASIGPGPDNPMGDAALYLAWPGYAIHGTNKPYSIGRRDSHGCIRLLPEDIAFLYDAVPVGTPVTVVDQQAKVGWSGGELYLEVHPTQADADALEESGAPRSSEAVDADDLVIKAAGLDAGRLDWYSVHLAETRRDGVPVQVTRPVPY
jgi:L,D-transpeptidase ErfK/SrfK